MKNQGAKGFESRNRGEAKDFLGSQFSRARPEGNLFFNSTDYSTDILTLAQVADSLPTDRSQDGKVP